MATSGVSVMINVYINYPNKKFSVHFDPACGSIRSHDKPEQRVVELNHKRATTELLKFANGQHKFASEKEFNDMWVIVDFDDADFERDVVDHVWRLLAKKYSPFRGINIDEHCSKNH
jgi:hypothetical protein